MNPEDTEGLDLEDAPISSEKLNVDIVEISEEPIEISDIHRGTVDNPFLYDAKNPELERFLLVNMFVAGKNASVQQEKLNQFVACVTRDLGSYVVENLGVLSAIHNTLSAEEAGEKIMGWLKEVKSGQYSRLAAGIAQLSEQIGSGKIDLQKCNRSNLVKIKGIGYKTASMFLMYTRRNQNVACLDTHILKYLREEAKIPDVPMSSPNVKAEYNRLESAFISLAQAVNKSVAEFDFEIWSRYRQKEHEEQAAGDSEATVTKVKKSKRAATGQVV